MASLLIETRKVLKRTVLTKTAAKPLLCLLVLFIDLAKALKQTKIVSCTLTPGPVQWKNTGKKFVKGNDDLGELEAFLMNKVRIVVQVLG